MAACPIPIGETLSGKYRVERVLGEGGMGVVVAAHHLELDQPVAIKFLLESLADKEEGAERFRREARAAAKIHSDHVVRVLDVGVMADGVRYMVMEYLEGRDLAEELAARGPFSLGAACGYILEAIDAVGHGHAAGIVHRDLKPANLFLATRPDGSQRIKVLDFGISKSVGASTGEQLSLTKTAAWIGSPLYMAPEQMQSARDVDARADVWSLGAILYELICGSPPYEAESLPQLCNLLITTDAPSIQTKNPGVPDDLAEGIMKCLVRDKEKRLADVGELAKIVVRYATTITGSGMSRVYSDNAFANSGVPTISARSPGVSAQLHGSKAAGMGTSGSGVIPVSFQSEGRLSSFNPTISQASGPSLAMDGGGGVVDVTLESEGATHSAWGATDEGSGKKKSSPLIWIVAALAVVLGVGYLLLDLGKTGADRAQKGDLIEEHEQAAPGALDANALVPEPRTADESESEGSDSEDAVGDSPSKNGGEVADSPSAPPPAPRPKPVVRRPAVRPAPRPVVKAPAPAPEPAPTPAPVSKPADEFSDFGGRR